ncbi:hypothetical protein LCGC14_0503810 [marine sediment metagenome]|uniref:Uncharacterized protein n=1 Tax=marine sediment metagenome TaxID=412755 RepID=A0A0F9VBV4_9ZZZZ
MKVIKKSTSEKPAFYTTVRNHYKPTVNQIATTHARHVKDDKEIRSWFVEKKGRKNGVSLNKK